MSLAKKGAEMTTLQICAICIAAFIIGTVFGIAVGISAEQTRAEEKKRIAEAEKNLNSQMSKFYSPELLEMIRHDAYKGADKLWPERKYTFSESGLRSLVEEAKREERIKVREEYYNMYRKARREQNDNQ